MVTTKGKCWRQYFATPGRDPLHNFRKRIGRRRTIGKIPRAIRAFHQHNIHIGQQFTRAKQGTTSGS
jgi:hypothetical protein